MFMRWGMFIYRFRRVVAALAVLVVLVAIPLASGVSAKLSSGGWLDPSSESAAVNDRLADQFGEGRSLLIAVVRDDADADAASAGFQARLTQALAPIASDSVRDAAKSQPIDPHVQPVAYDSD